MPSYAKLEGAAAAREARVLTLWEEKRAFPGSLKLREGAPQWVFYEGPPTANGRPHFGHLLPRVYKDLFPRYKTMRGFYVGRKGGWDTHGLPVELEVEKELGLNSKVEIERYGVERFIGKCKESVWRYKAEWERLIARMGFWIDLENAYVTYTDKYIETVWWALKRIWEQGLLYRGYKVLPYCPRCGTPLSSHEVAQGYKTVRDPSVYVRMPIEDREEGAAFLVWTTTPWTLPGNTALAVGPDFLYAKVRVGDEVFIMAKELLAQALGEEGYQLLGELKGEELIGLRYRPPYELLRDGNAYRVVAADFVNLVEGTGIVHIAPAFGEEDYQLGQAGGLEFIRPVDQAGRFTADFPLAAGRFVKEADAEIIADLQRRGLLYRHQLYEHEYPFCWRCDTPLLYYALDSYFIKTTARQAEIIENNRNIHWHPGHMAEGRFGEFLKTMKDWALSRNRYWGTPLPIWVCEGCGREICVGSRAELLSLATDKSCAERVEPHRPFIDELVLKCPECGGEMRRVPYVIDAWFDSGMMHTAQWHYPFENQELFAEQFPADFISEGQDQTRGWFYTLLVTSTLLHGREAYKNVIVTGYGLDEEGRAMSKSRGNVIDPWPVIERYGADAVRWYLYSSSAPWKTRQLSPKGVGEALLGFLETVKNVYNFFALYAEIDRFAPQEHQLPVARRSLLDRWVLSRLSGTIGEVTAALEEFDPVAATAALVRLVEDLSNWYVRSSRRRFWGGEMDEDKVAAYLTLYQVLLELSKLLAPFVPFLAESIYQGLRAEGMPESVHHCDWPSVEKEALDRELELLMAQARAIIAAGHQARNKAQIKVRQPLSKMAVFSPGPGLAGWEPELEGLVSSELNIKELKFIESGSDDYYEFFTPQLVPIAAQLGPKFRDRAPQVIEELSKLNLDGAEHRRRVALARELETKGSCTLTVADQDFRLERGLDVRVEPIPREGFEVGVEGSWTVVICTAIDQELRWEGYVRELIHQVQLLRKEAGFEVTDRIALYYEADGELAAAIARYGERIKAEVLATSLAPGLPGELDHRSECEVNGQRALVGLIRQRR